MHILDFFIWSDTLYFKYFQACLTGFLKFGKVTHNILVKFGYETYSLYVYMIKHVFTMAPGGMHGQVFNRVIDFESLVHGITAIGKVAI